MLKKVNDYSIPIEEILDEHFDLENIAYWMAFQLMVGNVDTQSRNFYIYSPQNMDRWYILPWDMDGSFGRRNDASKRPIDIISSNPIFERLITTNAQGFCDLLRQKWTELRDNVLSYDHMMGKFQAHYDALNACGMWEREAEAWPKFKAFTFDAAEELQYIYEYMLARAEFVEGYFAGDDLSAGDWLD